MIRRRVIDGQTYIRVRSGGWRLVVNGYIRTRRGWRKLRRAGKGGRGRPVYAAVSAITETAVPSSIEQPAAEPPRHRQWRGKYDMLRQPAEIERQDRT